MQPSSCAIEETQQRVPQAADDVRQVAGHALDRARQMLYPEPQPRLACEPGIAGVPDDSFRNHDYRRLASRSGPTANGPPPAPRLMLPGSVFIYKSDEIGQRDAPGRQPPIDGARRDAFATTRYGTAPTNTTVALRPPPPAPEYGEARDDASYWKLKLAQYLRQLAHEHGALFVARSDDGKALGYAFVADANANESSIWSVSAARVEDLAVAAAARRGGLGARLMAAVRDHAAGREIRLKVLWANTMARSFYEREGFAPRMLDMDCRQRWDGA